MSRLSSRLIRSSLTLSLALSAIGCGRTPRQETIEHLQTRIDESYAPMPFVVALANRGDAAAHINDTSIQIIDGVTLPQTNVTATRTETLSCEIDQLEEHPMRIDAGKEGVACGFVRWQLPADAQPAAAVVSASFTVSLADGRRIETPPMAFILSSESGFAEKATTELQLDRAAAASTLKQIESLPGRPSLGVKRLIERLKSLAN